LTVPSFSMMPAEKKKASSFESVLHIMAIPMICVAARDVEQVERQKAREHAVHEVHEEHDAQQHQHILLLRDALRVGGERGCRRHLTVLELVTTMVITGVGEFHRGSHAQPLGRHTPQVAGVGGDIDTTPYSNTTIIQKSNYAVIRTISEQDGDHQLCVHSGHFNFAWALALNGPS
jgi:hypothetical protein